MSAIQELAPFIGAYHGKIRNAKDHSGMTLEELCEPIICRNTSGSTAL